MFNFKKGAMFGLDARIALAIFGSLSVISGAALYSAIRESQVTAMYIQMTEVSKAVQAFYIDTAEYPRSYPSGSGYRLDLKELLDSDKKGWKGPYLSFNLSSNGAAIVNPITHEGVNFSVSAKDSWAACTPGIECEGWVLFYLDNGFDLAVDMDKKFDDGNLTTGNIKGWNSTGTVYALLLKYIHLTEDVS